MPKACKVCAHPNRAAIDRRLANQVVNVSALSREFGLNRNAVMSHRSHHLPDFLVALTAQAQLPEQEQVNAELQRLYLTTLDALARAEAGTLVQVGHTDGGPLYERIWSPSSVARLISEARKSLGLISALVAGSPQTSTPATSNAALEDAFMRALAREEQRALASSHHDDGADPHVVDAVVIDELPTAAGPRAFDQARAESIPGVDPPMRGSGANGAGGALPRPAEDPFTLEPPENTEGGLDSNHDRFRQGQQGSTDVTQGTPQLSSYAASLDIASPTPAPTVDRLTSDKRAAELYLAGLPAEVRQHIAEVIDQALSNDVLNPERIERPWPGNPAASLEERRAEGWPDPAPLEHPLDAQPEVNPATDRTSRGRPWSSDPNLPPAGRRA